jgi:pyruvate/2-oxoglutarate dehydrogenase complex dihydrolipoamide dehydrogenase (E3) component
MEVKVQLGVEVTPELVAQLQPDVVILAAGALPYVPPEPRFQNRKCITVEDYLKKRADVGQKVVIVGGQHGCETAVSLSREGKKVTLVEESDSLANTPYIFGVRRLVLLGYLQEAKVELRLKTQVKEISEQGVRILRPDGQEELLEADSVILALGEIPNDGLARALEGKVPEIYQVGDCVEPNNIMYAIHSAYRVAKEI